MWTLAVTLRTVLAAAIMSGAVIGAAAAQPSKPQTFILYFDAGSSRLSRPAMSVADQAAQAIKRARDRQEISHVKVIGYSDTVGSVEGAQRLSEQRAGAVKQELVRDGIAADFIATEGRGKLELAVSTADQVDQPRNRRVRIILYRPGD